MQRCLTTGNRLAGAVGIAVVCSLVWVDGASAQGFEFAGLSLSTTRGEAARRYPTSELAEHHVYLSPREIHDGISTIELPDARSGTGRLRVFFERRTAAAPEYPSCEKILALLRPRYGEPGTVQRSAEEQTAVRRMLWRRGGEVLTLVCFSKGARAPLSAETLIIERMP